MYYKRQLWTYCLKVHNLRTKKACMYAWDKNISSHSPDKIGLCIIHFLKIKTTSKKIIMYSDCCSGQNRNIKMTVLIVSSPNFSKEQIEHKLLVRGHTYLQHDSDFDFIEKNKQFNQIFLSHMLRQKGLWNDPDNISEFNFYIEITKITYTTNQKVNTEGNKVQWLKMLYLLYKKNLYVVSYKYGHSEVHVCQKLELRKRQ